VLVITTKYSKVQTAAKAACYLCQNDKLRHNIKIKLITAVAICIISQLQVAGED